MNTGKKLTESGSASDDLAGASRMAPLVAVYGDNLDGLVQVVARTDRHHAHG